MLLKAAEKGLKKLFNGVNMLKDLAASKEKTFNVNELIEKCYAAMNDDFNTPILISHLFDGVKLVNSVKIGKDQLTKKCIEKLTLMYDTFLTNILGLTLNNNKVNNEVTNDLMQLILNLRNDAKRKKDFITADNIRDKLKEIGIKIKDHRGY